MAGHPVKKITAFRKYDSPVGSSFLSYGLKIALKAQRVHSYLKLKFQNKKNNSLKAYQFQSIFEG